MVLCDSTISPRRRADSIPRLHERPAWPFTSSGGCDAGSRVAGSMRQGARWQRRKGARCTAGPCGRDPFLSRTNGVRAVPLAQPGRTAGVPSPPPSRPWRAPAGGAARSCRWAPGAAPPPGGTRPGRLRRSRLAELHGRAETHRWTEGHGQHRSGVRHRPALSECRDRGKQRGATSQRSARDQQGTSPGHGQSVGRCLRSCQTSH